MQDNLTPDGILIKELAGFPGYGVTADGRVWSKKGRASRGQWKLFKAPPDRYGYPTAVMSFGPKVIAERVHRMVAVAFLPSVRTAQCINHIDGNKSNNYWCNLEWSTYSQNMEHASRMSLLPHGVDVCTSKLSEQDVQSIRVELASGCTGKYLASKYSMSRGAISRINTGKAWAHLEPNANPNKNCLADDPTIGNKRTT